MRALRQPPILLVGVLIWIVLAVAYFRSSRPPETYLPAMEFSIAAWLLGAGTARLSKAERDAAERDED